MATHTEDQDLISVEDWIQSMDQAFLQVPKDWTDEDLFYQSLSYVPHKFASQIRRYPYLCENFTNTWSCLKKCLLESFGRRTPEPPDEFWEHSQSETNDGKNQEQGDHDAYSDEESYYDSEDADHSEYESDYEDACSYYSSDNFDPPGNESDFGDDEVCPNMDQNAGSHNSESASDHDKSHGGSESRYPRSNHPDWYNRYSSLMRSVTHAYWQGEELSQFVRERAEDAIKQDLEYLAKKYGTHSKRASHNTQSTDNNCSENSDPQDACPNPDQSLNEISEVQCASPVPALDNSPKQDLLTSNSRKAGTSTPKTPEPLPGIENFHFCQAVMLSVNSGRETKWIGPARIVIWQPHRLQVKFDNNHDPTRWIQNLRRLRPLTDFLKQGEGYVLKNVTSETQNSPRGDTKGETHTLQAGQAHLEQKSSVPNDVGVHCDKQSYVQDNMGAHSKQETDHENDEHKESYNGSENSHPPEKDESEDEKLERSLILFSGYYWPYHTGYYCADHDQICKDLCPAVRSAMDQDEHFAEREVRYNCLPHMYQQYCSSACPLVSKALNWINFYEQARPEARYSCFHHNKHCRVTCPHIQSDIDEDEDFEETKAEFICTVHRSFCKADCDHIQDLLDRYKGKEEDPGRVKDLTPFKIEPNSGSDISNEKDLEDDDPYVASPEQINTVIAWVARFDQQYSQDALAEEELFLAASNAASQEGGLLHEVVTEYLKQIVPYPICQNWPALRTTTLESYGLLEPGEFDELCSQMYMTIDDALPREKTPEKHTCSSQIPPNTLPNSLGSAHLELKAAPSKPGHFTASECSTDTPLGCDHKSKDPHDVSTQNRKPEKASTPWAILPPIVERPEPEAGSHVLPHNPAGNNPIAEAPFPPLDDHLHWPTLRTSALRKDRSRHPTKSPINEAHHRRNQMATLINSPFIEDPSEGTPEKPTSSRKLLPDELPNHLIAAPLELTAAPPKFDHFSDTKCHMAAPLGRPSSANSHEHDQFGTTNDFSGTKDLKNFQSSKILPNRAPDCLSTNLLAHHQLSDTKCLSVTPLMPSNSASPPSRDQLGNTMCLNDASELKSAQISEISPNNVSIHFSANILASGQISDTSCLRVAPLGQANSATTNKSDQFNNTRCLSDDSDLKNFQSSKILPNRAPNHLGTNLTEHDQFSETRYLRAAPPGQPIHPKHADDSDLKYFQSSEILPNRAPSLLGTNLTKHDQFSETKCLRVAPPWQPIPPKHANSSTAKPPERDQLGDARCFCDTCELKELQHLDNLPYRDPNQLGISVPTRDQLITTNCLSTAPPEHDQFTYAKFFQANSPEYDARTKVFSTTRAHRCPNSHQDVPNFSSATTSDILLGKIPMNLSAAPEKNKISHSNIYTTNNETPKCQNGISHEHKTRHNDAQLIRTSTLHHDDQRSSTSAVPAKHTHKICHRMAEIFRNPHKIRKQYSVLNTLEKPTFTTQNSKDAVQTNGTLTSPTPNSAHYQHPSCKDLFQQGEGCRKKEHPTEALLATKQRLQPCKAALSAQNPGPDQDKKLPPHFQPLAPNATVQSSELTPKKPQQSHRTIKHHGILQLDLEGKDRTIRGKPNRLAAQGSCNPMIHAEQQENVGRIISHPRLPLQNQHRKGNSTTQLVEQDQRGRHLRDPQPSEATLSTNQDTPHPRMNLGSSMNQGFIQSSSPFLFQEDIWKHRIRERHPFIIPKSPWSNSIMKGVATAATKVSTIQFTRESIKGPLTKGRDIKQDLLIKASC